MNISLLSQLRSEVVAVGYGNDIDDLTIRVELEIFGFANTDDFSIGLFALQGVGDGGAVAVYDRSIQLEGKVGELAKVTWPADN